MPARNQNSNERNKPSEQVELGKTFVDSGHQFNNRYNATEQQSSLAMDQTFNSHSIIHIVLSSFTLPLALANLREQYNHIKHLKIRQIPKTNKNESLKPKSDDKLTTGIADPSKDSTKNTTTKQFGGSEFFQESYRSPQTINNNLIFIKKAQLASSAINVLLSLIVTGVVISAIFTGGLSLGALSLAAMLVASIKIVMDVHLANKETKLKKEFFESKVLTDIENMDVDLHTKYEPFVNEQDKTVIMVAIALLNKGTTEYPKSELREYVLNQRQGILENAKMRNIQLGFSFLGLGIWLATNYLTLGLAGVLLSAGATTLSIAASISNTKFVQNALGPNITEWFRTFFSRKKGEEFHLYDYKNKEIKSFIEDIGDKHNNLSQFFEVYPSRQLSSHAIINKGLNDAVKTTHSDPKTSETITPPDPKVSETTTPTPNQDENRDLNLANDQLNTDNDLSLSKNMSSGLGNHF